MISPAEKFERSKRTIHILIMKIYCIHNQAV